MKLRTFALTAACAAALVVSLPAHLAPSAAAEDAPAAAGEKITLAMTPAKGTSFATEMKMSMLQAMSFGGMDIDSDIKMTSVTRADVSDVSETGDVTMKIKVTRMSGSMSNPMMGEIAFDSDKPEADADNPMAAQISQAFLQGVGQEIQAVCAKNGEVKSMVGGPEMAGGDLGDMIGGMGGMPDKPIGVGDSWTLDKTRNMQGMQIRVKAKYTLKSFDADTATVAVTGEMSMAGGGGGDDGGNPMAAVMARMKMKTSKMEGTTKVSRKDGLAISGDVETVMEMSMDADPNAADPMAAQGMSMKMTMKMHQERKPASYADKKPVAPETPVKEGEAKPAETK
ncbi:MAG: hypothetical protein HMLKMBBP_00694 [Planctomycetes bacterium]|nr:hypothetical protein [Planctomycetota bacterium]